MIRGELSGIPLFYTEGPEPAMASLQFRVGIADERPIHRGITHLVEHLALHSFVETKHDFNAMVDLTSTNFFAAGTMTELEGFFSHVVGALNAPPLDRFATETKVLTAEAAGTGMTVDQHLLSLRYGYRDYGVIALPELGLEWIKETDLAAWCRSGFTRGNAALWVHGPVLPRWELPFRDGERWQLPETRPLDGVAFPSFNPEIGGASAVGLQMPRSFEATLTLRIMHDRLFERLRRRDGVVYSILDDYQAIGGEQAHVVLGAECLDRDSEHVTAAVWEELRNIAEHGPSEAELTSVKQRALRDFAENTTPERSALNRAVNEELLGSGFQSEIELKTELTAVTIDTIREQFSDSSDRAILVAPPHVAKPDPRLREWDPPTYPVCGQRFAQKGLLGKDSLIVGKEGVALERKGTIHAVPADRIALITCADNGEITVLGEDLLWMTFKPSSFKQSDEIGRVIEALAPGGLQQLKNDRIAIVDKLVDEKLRRRWVVSTELSLLPNVLEDGELPLTLAEASRGIKAGLLVVTDRRLLFLYAGLRKEEFLNFPRHAVESVKPIGIGRHGITFNIEGKRFRFTDLHPRSRASEVRKILSNPPQRDLYDAASA